MKVEAKWWVHTRVRQQHENRQLNVTPPNSLELHPTGLLWICTV